MRLVIRAYQEWEAIYRILKARHIRDMATRLDHSKQPSKKTQKLFKKTQKQPKSTQQQHYVPAYMAERVDRGKALPEVKLVGGGRTSTRGQGGDERALRRAVLAYVVGDMKGELVEELKELM